MFNCRTLKAAKPHQCSWCGEAIATGTTYVRQFVVYDGDAWLKKLHVECRVAEEAYDFDGGEHEYHGQMSRGHNHEPGYNCDATCPKHNTGDSQVSNSKIKVAFRPKFDVAIEAGVNPGWQTCELDLSQLSPAARCRLSWCFENVRVKPSSCHPSNAAEIRVACEARGVDAMLDFSTYPYRIEGVDQSTTLEETVAAIEAIVAKEAEAKKAQEAKKAKQAELQGKIAATKAELERLCEELRNL